MLTKPMSSLIRYTWPFAALLLISWGFTAHRKIAEMAIFTLPPDMLGFYKANMNFLSEHSVDPDKKRYIDPLEGGRHFFDSEEYGDHPFDSVPRKWQDALTRYGADSLNKMGTVPWQIQRSYYSLVRAFERKDARKILLQSAHLSHYIADAHVPLHVTRNYNGQFTGQRGIHAFWESRLPELFMHHYDFLVGKAEYISHPLDTAWAIIRKSYTYKDLVFERERQLRATFPQALVYAYSLRKDILSRQYSVQYSKAYHLSLEGLVEQRMRAAVKSTGSFWFSAWVDAGQPDLKHLKKTKRETVKDSSSLIYRLKNWLGRPDL